MYYTLLTNLYRQITIKSRGDPDKRKRKRGRQEPSPTRDEPRQDRSNTPVGDTVPVPSHGRDDALPTTPGNTLPPPSTTSPARPWPTAPLAPGVDSKTPKTANKVYDNMVATMLNEVQHKFECFLFVKNAYPDLDTQIGWSTECWETICTDSQCYFELSKEMRNLVRDPPLLVWLAGHSAQTDQGKVLAWLGCGPPARPPGH